MLQLLILFCAFCVGESEWLKAAEEVRQAVNTSFTAYLRFASGSDDLAPLSRQGIHWLNAEATLFDSLSTLWVTNLHNHFKNAVENIRSGRSSTSTGVLLSGKTFEYHLRVVGGLTSAYSLSGESVLLTAALEAAEGILDAIAVSETPIPVPHARMIPRRQPLRWIAGRIIDMVRYKIDHNGMQCNSLAGAGSFGPEMRWLSRETGDSRYADAAERIGQRIATEFTGDNWLPAYWSTSMMTNCSKDVVSIGSGGDSYYEYVLKEYLLFPDNQNIKQRFDRLYQPWIMKNVKNAFSSFEHLKCFAPGMIALSGDLELATEMIQICVEQYTNKVYGLSGDTENDLRYRLRPETVESLFYLWRLTGKQEFRTQSLKIWRSIRDNCGLADGSFSGLLNVNTGTFDDVQPSYFIAETLKYLYLTFTDDAIPLEDWVFTTEGHPLRVEPYVRKMEHKLYFWAFWDFWWLEWVLLLGGALWILKKLMSMRLTHVRLKAI
jgi:mannosyl-oligosaccharide alpha-1,2-mannosidase